MEDGTVLNLCKGCIAGSNARSTIGQDEINLHSTHQFAVDWIDKVDSLLHEDEMGILATASCAHASATLENNCIEYGRHVKHFMKLKIPDLQIYSMSYPLGPTI
eukprot:15341206-Ditylum_brightwellii.AAC.1